MSPEVSHGPLHPERIRQVIRRLTSLGADNLNPEQQTTLAALELVRKGQLALGLTGQTVDTLSNNLQALAILGRLGERLR